jgi:hypothetical protein
MVFLGAVLILSGGVKALDLNLFVRQIQSYALITHPQLTALAAWAIASIECILGIALLLNYRPRVTLALTFTLLVAFTFLTLHAAIQGRVEDCGCFGALVKRSPMQAAIEDGVLLFLCLVAWRATRATRATRAGFNRAVWPRSLGVGIVALVALILPLFTGLPSALLTERSPDGAVIWTEMKVEGITGLDFSKGAHLVVLMSASCQHCQDAVPEVAMLMDELQSTPLSIVGLSQDSLEDLRGFVEEWAPPYPIGRIDSGTFWSLLADAELPRFFLVNAGRLSGVWDAVVPSADEVHQLLPQ